MSITVGIGKEPKWWKKIRKSEMCRLIQVQDHTSYSSDGKYVYFEPYNAGVEAIKELISFCEEYNLEFNISGESTWFVGNTFLIMIWKKENDLNG